MTPARSPASPRNLTFDRILGERKASKPTAPAASLAAWLSHVRPLTSKRDDVNHLVQETLRTCLHIMRDADWDVDDALAAMFQITPKGPEAWSKALVGMVPGLKENKHRAWFLDAHARLVPEAEALAAKLEDAPRDWAELEVKALVTESLSACIIMAGMANLNWATIAEAVRGE